MKKTILLITISFFLTSCGTQSETPTMSTIQLADKIAYTDKINNKVVFESDQYKMILFALKSDQILKPHSAPLDAPFLMLEGSAKITIGTDEHTVIAGDMITLPKDINHGVYPTTDCKFLLLK